MSARFFILKGCQQSFIWLALGTFSHPFRMLIHFRGLVTGGVADAQPRSAAFPHNSTA